MSQELEREKKTRWISIVYVRVRSCVRLFVELAVAQWDVNDLASKMSCYSSCATWFQSLTLAGPGLFCFLVLLLLL